MAKVPEYVIDDEVQASMISFHGHLTALETRRALDVFSGEFGGVPDLEFLERVALARAAVHCWRVNDPEDAPMWCDGHWWAHCEPDVDGAEPFTDVVWG